MLLRDQRASDMTVTHGQRGRGNSRPQDWGPPSRLKPASYLYLATQTSPKLGISRTNWTVRRTGSSPSLRYLIVTSHRGPRPVACTFVVRTVERSASPTPVSRRADALASVNPAAAEASIFGTGPQQVRVQRARPPVGSGLKFTSSENGRVMALRYYRARQGRDEPRRHAVVHERPGARAGHLPGHREARLAAGRAHDTR